MLEWVLMGQSFQKTYQIVQIFDIWGQAMFVNWDRFFFLQMLQKRFSCMYYSKNRLLVAKDYIEQLMFVLSLLILKCKWIKFFQWHVQRVFANLHISIVFFHSISVIWKLIRASGCTISAKFFSPKKLCLWYIFKNIRKSVLLRIFKFALFPVVGSCSSLCFSNFYLLNSDIILIN